jgi:hypothetical protein
MKEVIVEFDQFLLTKGLCFSAVIIGGAALNIMDISSRKTRDVDCLDPEIPVEIKIASKDFATIRSDLGLDINWLNNGPITLKTDLPNGWRARIDTLFVGKSLNLSVLGRADLLKSKLFAYCDRITPDFEDLKDAIDWVQNRDAHPSWPAHVEKSFSILSKALLHDK